MQIYRSAFFNDVGQATNSNQQQPTATNSNEYGELTNNNGLNKTVSFSFLPVLFPDIKRQS